MTDKLLKAVVSLCLHGGRAGSLGKGMEGAIFLHGGSAGEKLVEHQGKN